MSGFNTIKKSRKRSHEIEEKLNVLNRELEKTKDIQEITMNTSDLYTPVAATLPQDPVQVPNPDPSATGPTTGNWSQPVGDGEDGGTAGDIPTSFPKIWNNPGYQDAGAGFYGANGEPLYSEDDLNYTIPPASETGGVAALGGMQRERLGTDPRVVTGYIRRDVNVNQFVDTDDGFIEHNGVAVTFKTHPELFVPVNYWVSFSIFNPHIDAYWPNNSLGNTPQYQGVVAGSEDSNPRAMLTAYKYVGGARTQTFDPVGDRGSTTAGDSKGTGDGDQYPPLPFGPEAFGSLGELAGGPTMDDYFYLKDMYGSKAAEWYLKYGRGKYNPHIPGGGYLPFAPYVNKAQATTGDGTEIASIPNWLKKSFNLDDEADERALERSKKFLKNKKKNLNKKLFPGGIGSGSAITEGDLLKENAYMALLHRGLKPNELDYVKYGVKTPEDRKAFNIVLKNIEKYIRKNPDKFEYVMKRYPKNDPRLSMLNYKMDKMTEASDMYLETQFPTNQDLFTKVKERTKKNMNLTDPKNFKPVKDPIKYVDVKKTKKLKETIVRHFNKPIKSKSMFGLNMGKVRKTNQKMVEKREQEQRIKEEDKAYIEERMSRQKSNWKDDLTDL